MKFSCANFSTKKTLNISSYFIEQISLQKIEVFLSRLIKLFKVDTIQRFKLIHEATRIVKISIVNLKPIKR